MTIAPSDALMVVLLAFPILGVLFLGFLAQLLVRVALGGEARGE